MLERAYHAGIKIITVDTFIGDGDYASGSVTFPLAYIGADDAAPPRTLAAEQDRGSGCAQGLQCARRRAPLTGCARGCITEIIAQKPFDMGYWAAVLAVAHARGYESIPKRVPVDDVRIDAD